MEISAVEMAALELKTVVDALGLVVAAAAFAIGLGQYRKAQAWKRAEWVAQEMRELMERPLVRSALQMIDWGLRDVVLFPDAVPPAPRAVEITSAQVERAMMPHEEHGRFSDSETAIRDAFDELFDGIERLAAHVDARLITPGDLLPYLKYWAAGLAVNSEKNARLWAYMEHYGFEGAAQLLRQVAKLRAG